MRIVVISHHPSISESRLLSIIILYVSAVIITIVLTHDYRHHAYLEAVACIFVEHFPIDIFSMSPYL
jgi:hypothetical protein